MFDLEKPKNLVCVSEQNKYISAAATAVLLHLIREERLPPRQRCVSGVA
jgi:hypothetical protein